MNRLPFGSNTKPKIRIGAFWQKVTEDSEKFLSGDIEINAELLAAINNPQVNKNGNKIIRVNVVKNKDKQPGTFQPDYRLVLGS